MTFITMMSWRGVETDEDEDNWEPHVDQDGVHVCTEEICDVIDRIFWM